MTATSFLLFLKTFCFGSLCSERFGRLFPTLGVPTERRCLRPWWNCSITPNAGVNVPPMWGWSRRTAATGGDDAGALLHRWYGRHWKARLNEMFWEFPKMFCSRTLVGCFFFGMCTSFLFFYWEVNRFLLFWKVIHFYNFEFRIVTDYCRNLETWLSIQRQFWKVYLLHLWIQLEKKGCCESFFAASKSEHMWKDNSASYIIFSEWLYCKIAIIFGVQNTIDTSFVQQDFLPSLFRVKVFAYPASWCKRLPTRWWFLVAFSTHENPPGFRLTNPVLMTL